MAALLTLDTLTILSTSVPDWIKRLDDLNSTIAQRQIELAKLTGDGKPIPPSIKNKGSTESLRPRDDTTPPPQHHDDPFDLPSSTGHVHSHLAPVTSTQSATVTTPPLSGPKSAPIELSRKLSQNIPTAHGRFGLRKRKTESMISNESAQAPKYRTRSMIIVYYDSTVQGAFEDLVRYISANRNSMRKGKMNAKMEAMKRAAEQDAQNDDDDDDDDNGEEEYSIPKFTNARSPLRLGRAGGALSQTPQFPQPSTQTASIGADEADVAGTEEPPLNFVSTRNMGPPRHPSGGGAGRLAASMMARNHRLGGPALEINDIFDILDNGLEWCQGQCERAAHQFLRDGDCSSEIEGIKKRLLDVKSRSDKEIERLKEEEAKTPRPPQKREIKSRELRGPMMRKAALLSAVEGEEVDSHPGLRDDKVKVTKANAMTKKAVDADQKLVVDANEKPSDSEKKRQVDMDNRNLEVDAMEVDEDEGVEEDIELPPMLTFRRTRDMVR